MEVQAQILQAYFDEKGSMFDFVVYFFIIDPRNSAVEAFYVFDKLSTSQQNKVVKQIDKMPPKEAGKRTQSFVGADDTDTNEKKPFKFDTLTGGKLGTNVKAQVELASFNSKGFTITVSLREKKNHSVDVTFKGDKPSWLDVDGKNIFHGELVMYEVKDFNAKRKAS